jgi:hypothetical protein
MIYCKFMRLLCPAFRPEVNSFNVFPITVKATTWMNFDQKMAVWQHASRRIVMLLLLFLTMGSGAHGETKKIGVFVGLCDNKTQSIAKVNARIGDGDHADANLYWGCSDGLKSYFKASQKWKLTEGATSTGDARILERLKFRHVKHDTILTAEAWRGSNLRECYEAFQFAAVSGGYDFVVFIGHNVLMDGPIALPASPAIRPTPVLVLCCKSERYFRARLEAMRVTPLLLTSQSMYPGAFLLHDALESWLSGGTATDIRNAAGKAYAKNQKISVNAALGVFADLTQPNQFPLPMETIPAATTKQPSWGSATIWGISALGVLAIALLLRLVYRRMRKESARSLERKNVTAEL